MEKDACKTKFTEALFIFGLFEIWEKNDCECPLAIIFNRIYFWSMLLVFLRHLEKQNFFFLCETTMQCFISQLSMAWTVLDIKYILYQLNSNQLISFHHIHRSKKEKKNNSEENCSYLMAIFCYYIARERDTHKHKSMCNIANVELYFFALSLLKSMFDFQYLSINLAFVLFDLFVIWFFRFLFRFRFVSFQYVRWFAYFHPIYFHFMYLFVFLTPIPAIDSRYFSGIAICFCPALKSCYLLLGPFSLSISLYLFFLSLFFIHHVILILITFFYLFI